MKHFKVLMLISFVFGFYTSAEAFYIQKGIHGMKWGSSISEYDEITKVHEIQHAKFYVNSYTRYKTARQPVPRVSYGFYRDQFYAAFIRLRSPDQFAHLRRQFSKNHGKPKVTYNTASGQTVYRWIVEQVKIKMKMRESIGEYKLAFYFSPLATKLNRELLEQIPTEAYGPAPAEGAKSAPLLEY